MKTAIFAMFMLFVCVGTSFADTVYIPEDVKEVKSATFSSGGGNSAIVYVKVFCEMDDGREVLYIDEKISVAGAFGLGRINLPSKVEFIKTNAVHDKVEWAD